ncbi:bacillithiol system protein YtxJ [Cesiribacter andamanensis AMV16]|uniref:Bacillithiol system protein YtxJ n=2 Tax=Cesiribacter TaxID=1133570 RepID=M7NR65_9BACT|nr:bacillithiol system protein YtxJ [Cesiribacter andamanensis AMV16]
MKWNTLDSVEELEQLKQKSHQQPIIIFKHSTRCPISHMALSWFERSWNGEEMGAAEPWYLDLIQYRPVSSQVAAEFGVQHESPQLLLIEQGRCTYHRSHSNISYKELKKKLDQE